MRRWLAIFAGLAVAAGAQAPTRDGSPMLGPLRNGRLVIWVVHPGNGGPMQPAGLQPNQVQTQVVRNRSTLPSGVSSQGVGPNGLRELNAGDFGTAASDVGQTAGSYGQAPSTLGQNASTAGQAASTYGQASSDFGTASSNVGQTAGSYGQTAGSFGQTASTYGATLNGTPLSANAGGTGPAAAAPPAKAVSRSVEWTQMMGNLRAQFPGLQLSVVDVEEPNLARRLNAAVQTQTLPDVVFGSPQPGVWVGKYPELAGWRGVLEVGSTKRIAQDESVRAQHDWQPAVTVMQRAQHMDAARAFVLWLRGGERDCLSCGALQEAGSAQDAASAASAVAVRAFGNALQGARIGGDADAAMGAYDASALRRDALALSANADTGEMGVRVDVASEAGNDRLAVVTVRGVLASSKAFGVAFGLVVLRTDAAGHWRVLQMTPSLEVEQLREAQEMLAPFAKKVDVKAKVVGVTVAAPIDGDHRGVAPELWWDTGSGAGLQVVEWESGEDGKWMRSHLFFVPDAVSVVRTRVTASFADEVGVYRWRVWSVGAGGVVVLSPWRVLKIDH